jgi:hypothetical protein
VLVGEGLELGESGAPAAAAILRDSVLEPITRIASAGGPTQVRPAVSTRSANSAFSARNP